jgi:hypothetical protein
MMSCASGDHGGTAGRLHVLHELVEQILSPRHGDHVNAFHREPLGDGTADSDAGSGHDCGLGLEIEVHI